MNKIFLCFLYDFPINFYISGMAKENPTTPEKHITQINVTGVPVKTKEQLDNKADRQGITTSAYIKNLINQDLRGDKIDNFNKAG